MVSTHLSEKLKEQLGQQGMSVMVDDMNNVPVENSPEWIKFSTGNDNRFNQMFTQHTEQIKTLL